MSQIDLTAIAATSISTPAAGVTSTFVENIDKTLKRKNDAGYVNSFQNAISTSAQALTAATRTYITGTNIKVGATKLQTGTMFRWYITLTKTAAGIATSTFDIVIGTLGTTADTTRISFTKPVGTAAVDEGLIEIKCTVRSIGVAGVIVGNLLLTHNGNTAGHATIPAVVLTTVSAGFDTTTAGLQVGICATTGAADACTIQMVTSEWWDL